VRVGSVWGVAQQGPSTRRHPPEDPSPHRRSRATVGLAALIVVVDNDGYTVERAPERPPPGWALLDSLTRILGVTPPAPAPSGTV
jgi:hypothetical protein